MQLQPETDNLEEYLSEIPPIITFSTPLTSKAIGQIISKTNTPLERAKLAYKIARDEIKHSFDLNSDDITINAEDILEKHEGICFAKSHLLASLLRGLKIPTGFCYQRVLRKGNIESGYALHGLNALYLENIGWFRVDPRGNKPGINATFNIKEEQLAYPIRPELGEIDYPYIFTKPLPEVISSMQSSKDCHDLFYKRPETIKTLFKKKPPVKGDFHLFIL